MLDVAAPLVAVEKRDKTIVPFEKSKIRTAIEKASGSAKTNYDAKTLDELADRVALKLPGPIQDIEVVQDSIIDVLRQYAIEQFTDRVLGDAPQLDRPSLQKGLESAFSLGVDETSEVYQGYRDKRAFVRTMRLTKVGQVDTTDMSMVVEGDVNREEFSRNALMRMIIEKTNGRVPVKVVDEVSKSVEFSIFDAYKTTLEGNGNGDGKKDGEFEVSDVLLTELVNLELYRRGMKDQMIKDDFIGIRTADFKRLVSERSKENSNLKANSSEAISFLLAENLRKKFALRNVFSKEVAEAHRTGRVHVHDLGMPDRVYCSGHSIAYFEKYGLGLDNLDTTSSPARHARTLTGHLNTALASLQAYFAGALGMGFGNIMYAPYLEGMTRKEMRQEAQHLLFSLSQSAFSRGGQTLFLDMNVHTGVPSYLKNVPAIMPGGKYQKRTRKTLEEEVGVNIEGERRARVNEDFFLDDAGERQHVTYTLVTEDGTSIPIAHVPVDKKGKMIQPLSVRTRGGKLQISYEEREEVDEAPRIENPNNKDDPTIGDVLQPKNPDERYVTYGDLERTSQTFLEEMLKVWHEGDHKGGRFAFPKCDFHINEETFSDPKQKNLFMQACKIAGDTGDVYFVFDRSAVTLSQCCRLRTAVDDMYVVKHPESMRFCGVQNVTINFPQAAYRAKGETLEQKMQAVFKDLDETLEIAVQAHLQKKEFAKSLMKPGLPLWQIGKTAPDGRPYVDLDKSSYLVGIVGLNEAVQYITGKQMHESREAFEAGLRMINHLYQGAVAAEKRTGLSIKLEESPAESATRRLIAVDRRLYPEQSKKVLKGNEESDEQFYSNSIHIAADANVDFMTRAVDQSLFNELTQAGAIIHDFSGDEHIPAESVANMMEKLYRKTNAAQVVVSPTFTFCRDCGTRSRGFAETCSQDGSKEVYQVTRIVGYFSKIPDWNKSKKGELQARMDGDYSMINTSPEGEPYKAEFPEELMFHRHGKPGCKLCSLSDRKIEGLGGHGLKVEQRAYDLTDEKQRYESVLQGASLTSYPTVVLSGNGRELGRWVGTEFTKLSTKDLVAYVQQAKAGLDAESSAAS